MCSVGSACFDRKIKKEDKRMQRSLTVNTDKERTVKCMVMKKSLCRVEQEEIIAEGGRSIDT